MDVAAAGARGCVHVAVGVDPEEPERDGADTVFVDDMPVNVDAAWQLGFRAVRFESASALRSASSV